MIIGQTIRGAWTVTNLTTGAEENATGTPTAVLFRNGSVVVAATPSMSNPGTGHYHSGVLLDAGHSWVVGDHYALVASWVEPGTAAAKKLILAQGVITEAMRGTDGANTTAPNNTQGAAVITALGNGTVVLHSDYDAAKDAASSTNVTDAQTAIIAQVDANEVKIDNIQTSINTIDDIVDNILIDTNELQVDWTNGGRLDSIIDLILADTGTDGIVISSTTANQIADAILTRDWTLVSGEAARSALNALRILRNKVSESGGTLTITEEDDSTTAWTASVTTDVSANPIITIDPS